MPTIQAQDIVDAVIQDLQNQTTNRSALYDYTDRIHQRILRESQWRFLLSDPQRFVTMPGVASYSLISGSAPAGVFQTNLDLTDFYNVAPDSVYNLTAWTKIYEDPDDNTTLNYIVLRDGSLRYGYPRTYSMSLADPGVLTLKPVPDNQNFYYPVPETPVVTFTPVSGCLLPTRLYYGVVTFTDSVGGESTPCVIPFTIVVPAGNVLVVESPDPPPGGGIAGNQAVYSGWNLYLGYAIGDYNLQNYDPIAIGTNWEEPITGAYQGTVSIPNAVNIPVGGTNPELSISSAGFLSTEVTGSVQPQSVWALLDPNGNLWNVSLDNTGALQTTEIPLGGAVNLLTYIYLTDTDGTYVWKLTVDTSGLLESTVIGTASDFPYAKIPPTTSTLQPLNAYVIQFRYYKSRNQIANPTDVLQIPYVYKDIVVAGVAYLASKYLDQLAARAISANTLAYKKDFDEGLSQIRRDLRINYRKTDFIAPDVTTQYVVGNQQGIPTMGW